MLWRNERKLLTVVLRVEEFIDQVSVAKTQMLTASKQLGFFALRFALRLALRFYKNQEQKSKIPKLSLSV